MATGGKWSEVSTATTNFARICKLLMDGGTKVLREVFDSIYPPGSLRRTLLDPKNHNILQKLKSKGILFKEQWDKLYPPSSHAVDSKSFDITLLYLLLRSICNLPTPAAGWNNLPAPTSINTEDDIVRLKLFRNEIAHIERPALSDDDFDQYWNDISSVLVRLGGARYQQEIDDLKVVSMQPEDEKFYIQCLKEALQATEERILQRYDQQEEKMNEALCKLDKLGKVQNLIMKLSEDSAPDTRVELDADLFSENLKSAVKKKTQNHQEFFVSPIVDNLRLEDIFTNLIMYHRSRETTMSSSSRLLAGETTTEIQKTADIFLDKAKKENVKSISIVGNPGVGKSLFCRKLVQDWSTDRIFDPDKSAGNPDFKLAFLLTFRQLNNLASENLNLKELLNLCSMLDENTMINDSIMEYIIHHPEQLLILFDGFDEYQDRHNLISDFESSFPNDPKSKMPVTALISKMVKKKILPNAVVMVTSRPIEADEMTKNVHFDRSVSITGFSEQQVIEYVERYFKSNQEMQAKAISTIKGNSDYLTFGGQVPLMCLLMCVYIEHNIRISRICFPKTLTAFYTEIVQCIEENYNRAIKNSKLDKKTASSVVKKIKDQMSELAAMSFLRGQYSFTEKDLGNLSLSKLELFYLKSSSLLFIDASIKSAFSSSHEYSFCHTSFQEYFAALYFVKKKKIPPKSNRSYLTLQFMAGVMNPEHHKQLMKKLLKHIRKTEKDKVVKQGVSLTCLYEHGGGDLVKRILQKNKDYRYWDSKGWIELSHIDYKVVLMLVDILNKLSEQQSLPSSSPVPHWLYISNSPLTLSACNSLFVSLTNTCTTITVLLLYGCNVDDKCVECMCTYLPYTQLTSLNLYGNKITDNGAQHLANCNHKLEELGLLGNKITDEEHVRELFKVKHPHLKLYGI